MNEWLDKNIFDLLRLNAEGMTHGGLPTLWATLAILCMMTLLVTTSFMTHSPGIPIKLTSTPLLGRLLQPLLRSPAWIIVLRVITAAVFVLAITAGLFGTPIAERNLATTLTWTLWWSGIIIAIYFVGSAWCTICPWDTIANILVRLRVWYKPVFAKGLNLRVPKGLRTLWPASSMFIILTWFELGVGITTSPYATAILALTMIAMATLSLLLFERKAFCRHFCSVGRTIGFYTELSPLVLRANNNDICANCTTLDCYHGSEKIEACPTHLVIGRHEDVRYCTSCGACVFSCPKQNVDWHWQKKPLQRLTATRINSSEAWFILILATLTIFHGVTMLPLWETMVRQTAMALNDRGQLLLTFSILMSLAMLIPLGIYSLIIFLAQRLHRPQWEFSRLFNQFALPLLPIAFCYHIAHNLTHLVRESNGFTAVLLNPFGHNTLPMTMAEKHARHLYPLIPDDLTFMLQTLLIIIGFWWALRLFKQRVVHFPIGNLQQALLISFFFSTSLFDLWLLLQPMIMRM